MGCSGSAAANAGDSKPSSRKPTKGGKPVLGYWHIRAGPRGNLNRCLLHWAGVDFEDKRYLDVPAWKAEKETLPMQHPNLPYLKHGDFWISESKVVPAYICDTWAPELIGSGSPEMRARILQIQEQLVENFMKGLSSVFMTEDRESCAK